MHHNDNGLTKSSIISMNEFTLLLEPTYDFVYQTNP